MHPRIIMNNFRVSVEACGLEALEAALQLISMADETAFAYRIDADINVFTMFKYASSVDVSKGIMPLPVPHGPLMQASIIMKWLGSVKYPKEPDHDGDNRKGWYLTNIGATWQALYSIEPRWAMIGK